ncbi:fat-like cadherin-related tumor suppressor homolog isoform X4 [Cotesia glomerata]|uniref:fat-like cadherin-related tumor suppressor homolog isoform X4 n=1 Tax=Cotesia glomerata TaxID=32391 RepID=UPI001D0161D8|nr:fat-like cadherin-related tumor suppressor homolog isoform X4 [Cotesia glomerata]
MWKKHNRGGQSIWSWMWMWMWFIAATVGSASSGGHINSLDLNSQEAEGDNPITRIETVNHGSIFHKNHKNKSNKNHQNINNETNYLKFSKIQYNVTIPENSIGKTYVSSSDNEKMGIKLPYSLSSVSSIKRHQIDIKYRIVGGDRDKLFKAEELTVGDFCFLLIRTRTGNVVVLNRERKDRYVLQIRATWTWRNSPGKSSSSSISNNNNKTGEALKALGGLSGLGILGASGTTIVHQETETTVIVSVLDTNDLNPLFVPNEYIETVTEDTPLHKSILKVVAEDADLGINGEIYYSFAEETEQFAVHPVTGVITLTRPLRYVERAIHDLVVVAKDRGALDRGVGTMSRSSTARVTIRVQQVNLYAPEIYVNNLPDIVENSNADVYAIIRVVDRDEGIHGEIASLDIVGGDPDGHFRVRSGRKPGEYTIEILHVMDREGARQGYNLSLKAIDKGTPQRFSHKIVPVHLSDTNDNAPVFSNELYQVDISEISPINTPVIKLKVTDADEGKNSLVSLEIVGGNEGGEFNINGDTGMLYTAVPLDAEKKTLYTLTVSAVDQGNTGTRKQSSAKVKINILDANDNDPIFENSDMIIEIDENKPIGSNVIKLTARDKDSGENAYISYSIDNIEKIPFEIDPFTGLIKTKQVLDYETMKREYILSVRASDWGLPYRRQTEMQLRVKLRDINDNRPQFEKINCIVRLSRFIPIGSEILTVSAIDLDAGNIINYRIESSNQESCFSLDSVSGVLSSICDFTEIIDNEINVNITATDGTHFADINFVRIQLINVKTNYGSQDKIIDSEIITKTPTAATATATKTKVGLFNCHDTGVAKRLTDAIELAEKNNEPLLNINNGDNTYSGGVNNNNNNNNTPLKSRRYGGNVHTPEFIDFPTEIKVNESVKLGTTLIRIIAKDRDLDYNGKLIFGITSGDRDSVFSINQQTGDLNIIGYLDRERENEYFLNITVYDLGKPQKSSSKILPIIILDVNDNPPKFEKPLASFKISENALNGTIVFRANATDKDLGENSKINYSLITETNDFRVDSITGVLSVYGKLDRERQEIYELKIRASDNGGGGGGGNNIDNLQTSSLYSDALVRITVDDINDNPPKFPLSSYSVKVREDIPVSTVVAIIEATDPDEGPGGEIEYLLSDTMDTSEGYFKVDLLSGTVRTIKNLDFEQRQVHTITIIAKDRGEPSLSSETMLIIEVVDVNENIHPPVFDDYIVSTSVAENQPIGTIVTTVSAKDLDPPGQDSRISYSIRGGDGIGYFTIDDQGNIRTKAVLDVESKEGYWLTVYAQDHGVVPLSSQLQMYVQVLDENDNTPLTEFPVYYPSIPENSPAGVSVLEIKAFDGDISPQDFTFSITSGNPEGYFLINSTTGLITTSNRKLDRENQVEHILEVSVRDNGTPPLSSTTRVIVQVEDINDHGPEFEQKFYTVRIPASPNIDKPLFQVLANDKDVGENGKITYSIKGGRGKGKFRIHPTTGMVYSQKSFEVGQEYEMMIRAADNGDPQRSHQTRVSVQVVELPKESKYPPIFKSINQIATVTESDQVGFLVALVQATDQDGDTLWYDIIDGDERDEFFIGRDNGNVLLGRKLDWETKNNYNITISATDGIFTATTQLVINVIDINDHRPEFSEAIYRVDISENVDKGEKILQLYATDKDEDKKVFYSLHAAQNQKSLEIFHVDSITGTIILNDYLDRETIEEHILTVMVRDQGTPAKRNYARVIVTVHDHNDHIPEFTNEIINGKIYETSPIGAKVVQVNAIDRDRGDNGRIGYSITSGNVGNVFTIDQNLGIINTARELDMNVISEYILLVKAQDYGSPSLTNTVPVDVIVTMADNAPPRFLNGELAAEIYENQPTGSYVKHVEARSTSSLQFEILQGNKGDMFFINPSTGVITTKNRLDYEKMKFYNLTISATNMASATAYCNVIVHVLDRNDNPPKFLQAIYKGKISEGASIGSLVLTNSSTPLVIKAEDPDSELNALLSYDIVQDLPRKYFHIDSSTGAIRTVMILDHETINYFEFNVKVSDLGKPKLSSETTAKVMITVTDVNDCEPKFINNYYNATLLLPTYKNVAIVRVEAIDPDSKIIPLRYDIIDGNKDNKFEIDSQTGIITVKNTELIKKVYLLHVRVSDGKYSTVTQVNINVEESENSGLVFQKSIYEGTIVENSTKIMTVAVVNVLGTVLNEYIIFSILNPTDMFEIGHTSGAIRTTGKRFDRETIDHYELIVEAKSHTSDREKPRVAHVIVNVTILDINDNCPMFVNLPYYAVVSVDAQKSSIITKVHAIDMDSDDNGEVRYELKKGHGELFRVSRKTGEISLKQNLEGHNREYQLTIAAYDGGLTPCSIEVPVHVKVIDRSMPTFDKQFYTVDVFENIQIDSPLSLSIQAKSDLDRKLIYSITKGNDFEEFTLNFNTAPDNNNGPCTIYVVDELDYEQKKQYELTVRATDSVSGVYAEVLVSILVLDVNDCPPEFSQDSYNISVSEAAPFGTWILKVNTRDNDTDMNQQVVYAIENDTENSNDLFHIDPEEGVIFLKRSLDHESHDSHHFTVMATDRGNPPLSSTAHVWVTVIDMNDNPPKFEQPSYTCSLSEDAERGQFVTVVTASDPDYIDNNLTYTIVGGNDQQTYSIDQLTGIITLINMQNFGEQKLTMLNVSVTDGVYTSFTRVKIEILPGNNNDPKFINPLIEVNVMENQLPGRLVTTVLAKDKDFGDYGSIYYSIPSTMMRDVFDVNRLTGEITTKKKLDRETTKLYELLVMATDMGGRSGFVTVRIRVTDQNDNSPVFYLNQYKVSIHSNISINVPFINVRAYDIDDDEAAKIEYSIFEPEKNSQMKNIFGINPDNGGVFLIKNPVPLENQLFEFFIRATDKGPTIHHADVPISIYIISPNDIPPIFESKEDKFFISENSPIGTPITTLKLTTNTTVKYFIVSSLSDNENDQLFSINQQGQIKLAKTLDRELKDNHIIGILAETDSSPPLTALAEISLQVLDENDNPPKFESNRYSINLSENIEEGTSILKVIAHDLDLGNNGEVRYSFGSDIGELANVFTVDAYTGWISTLVSLDKEKQPEFKFQVIATDNGNPKHFARTSVYIKLNDYNDNPPSFVNDHYEATVKEDALPGTVVVKLTTIDKDIDLNTPVDFYITSGDKRSQFQVRSTGEVYVAKTLDRELIERYELNVIGTDGKFVFSTIVIVQVIDVNDNPPYCLRYRYREIISEGSHPGSYVLTVLATDYDDNINAKLRFYLTDDMNENNNDKFSLDQDTGVVKTIGQLDRETKSRYLLTAHVQDRDKSYWECSSQIEIIISDLNDNPPRFTMMTYNTALPEDVKVGTLVTKVHATDEDIGINRKIIYEFIDSSDGHFIITPDTGIVTLAKPLDRETKEIYNLTVKAIDQGTPQLFSTANLIVTVQDINDNPPEFTSKSYFASVPEIDQVNTEIVRVLAESKDTGINAIVYYSIIGGNEHKKFNINNKTGVITIAEQLDYERARDYFLTIQAIDAGIPPLSNYATVNITITDCNDNAPIFNQLSYRGSIREDAPLNEQVTQLFASDLDSNENGKIFYYIERGDRYKHFNIDHNTGIVTVNGGLDRETIPHYALEIHARDNGKPVLESFVILNIEVIDANDNPPLFSQSNYSAVVQEDKKIGHVVIKFIVTDADISPNADPYTFDFRSGNEGDAFRLEQDGSLRTAIKFNSRVKDNYLLHIRVFDNGSQPLYSDAWIKIKIIEESQYPPIITPLEITINSYLDEYPGGKIGKVHASDRDQYDTLSYSIVPSSSLSSSSSSSSSSIIGDLFKIDKNQGTLEALPRLDVGEYRLNISVNDGKYYSYSLIKITVELITEKMLENTVIVRFREVSPEDFILSHRKGFMRTIRNAMNCRLKDIVIISIQPSFDEINIVNNNNKLSRVNRQAIHNDLDLLFSVRKSNPILGLPGFYSSESIREALNQHIEELEESTKLVVEEIVRFKCNKGHCIYGDCIDKIILDQIDLIPIATDVMSFVSPKYKYKIECSCKEGYAGNKCEIVINECATDPCQSFKICIPDSSVQGYTCQCPEGFAGPTCDIDISKCHDESCYLPRNPISFTGKSYTHYKIDYEKKSQTIENNFILSLRIRTVQPTGNLMYAAGKIDYNILEIVNGAAQYKFDLGSGEGLVRVSSVYVSDGQWHEIHLERESNSARLTVDGKHIAHGSAPGINDILNLQSDDLYFGAQVRQHPSILGFEDIQRGFIGCMDDIRISKLSVPLHMTGSTNSNNNNNNNNNNNIVILKRFANVEFNCDASSILIPPGICGSQPCQNGGTCREIDGGDRYECHCHDRFKGIACEIDTDPCASSPCLYNGRCKLIDGGGDYICECTGPNLTGKRCQFGKYCNPNPCINGGICEEGNNAPICKCNGFTGDHCDIDVNECHSNPCINGGTCVNEIGTYRCICPPNMTGINCVNPIYSPSIISQHLNITWEQFIWIGISILVIIFIIIIFLTYKKIRNKRTDACTNNINNETRKQIVLNSARPNDHEFKRSSKLSNLEVIQREPPQCPPRPASYTPSSNNEPSYGTTAAVALNNLDTLRSYGSAGDELENFPPDYLRNLNRSTPVPNPTLALANPVGGNTTGSDADSLHKPTWQEQMYLASFISDTAKIKNDLKRASPVVPELTTGGLLLNSTRRTPHRGTSSIASLSSCEDDPRIVGGYHWDCSDWVRPSQNPLPNITEVPGSEVPDSSSFHSNESNESNTHQLPLVHSSIDPSRDISTLNEDQESEYIGDSECGTEFSEHYNCPESQRLNPLDSGGEGEYKYKDSDSYLRHPNSYLPHYNIQTDTENEMNPLNGRLSTLESDEEEDDVVPYGFPSVRRNRCKGEDNDDIGSVITTLEERNSLLGGGTSNSDLSTNLCEIDDSECEINDKKNNARMWLSGNGVTQTSV